MRVVANVSTWKSVVVDNLPEVVSKEDTNENVSDVRARVTAPAPVLVQYEFYDHRA